MSMSSILFDQLETPPEGLLIQAASAASDDNRPPTPFAEVRWGLRQPGMGQMKRTTVEIFVHDEPGSYKRINRILAWLEARLDGKEHLADGEGGWLNSVKWTGTSGDLYDTGFRTNMKSITFEVIGTGA